MGISGILIRKEASSFFAEHKDRIEAGAQPGPVLYELEQGRRSMARQLAGMHLLMAAAAISAFSIALGFVWRRRVSQPMALLSDRIHKMKLGTWSQPIPVDENDEIGTLTREFNDLGPDLAFTAHQYAAASRLAAMALIGQRIVRRILATRERLLAVSAALERLRGDEHFHETAVEQIRLVAGELQRVAADFDSEFQSELTRVGAARVSSETQGGYRAS